MKLLLTAKTLILCSLVGANGAITYSTGFEAPPFNNSNGEIAGTDGWVISNPTPDLSFVVQSWNSGVAPASQAAGLGGLFSNAGPAGTVVNLTHPVSIALTSLQFNVDFAVVAATMQFPGKDSFGWTFLGSNPMAGPLLRVAFEVPGGNGDLEIAWYDNTGARHLITPISQDIFYNTTYQLDIDVTPSGMNAAFAATLTGTGTVNFGGTLAGAGGATLSAVGARMDVVGNSDSYLLFDKFSVIPEPQVGLLLAISLLGLATRRRKSKSA